MAVFDGPQSYVSPSFCLSKARDGKDVPTWNCAVVHAHGHAPAEHEPAAVLDIITYL
jgi:transcriptional regulator